MEEDRNTGNEDRLSREFEELLPKLRVPGNVDEQAAWQKLTHRIAADTGRKRSLHMHKQIYSVRWAAIILVLVTLGAGLAYTIGQFQKITAPGERAQIVLPDGSNVICDAASEISYNKFTWMFSRDVNLSGRAFFKVRPGRKFDVLTSVGTVTVKGTQFTVEERDSIMDVFCLTGKVAVSTGDQSVLLLPGEKAIERQHSLLKKNADKKMEMGWVNGTFHFDEAPLSLVIKTLETQFGITFKGDFESQKAFTGDFDNKNLKQALETVFAPLNISYKIEGNKVILN